MYFFHSINEIASRVERNQQIFCKLLMNIAQDFNFDIGSKLGKIQLKIKINLWNTE